MLISIQKTPRRTDRSVILCLCRSFVRHGSLLHATVMIQLPEDKSLALAEDHNFFF
jgi:hypothetical protein